MGKPNWKLWNQMERVDVFQACALSLDVDPDSLHVTDLLSLQFGGFMSDDTATTFHDRYRLATNSERFGGRSFALHEFAIWAEKMGWEFPAEFIDASLQSANRLIENSASCNVDRPTHQPADGEQVHPGGKGIPWWQQDYDIMLLASNAGASLRRQGKRTSNRAIGDAIANRIESEELRGEKRKPPTGEHIKNTVLKGWKYVPAD